MNNIKKIVNIVLICAIISLDAHNNLPPHVNHSSTQEKPTLGQKKPTNYYVHKIKKSIRKNNKKKFTKYFSQYLKGFQSANDKVCNILANTPEFLQKAVDLGFIISDAEASSLVKKTKKTDTIDIILKSQPIQSFWLGIASCKKVTNYLLEKGAQINQEQFGKVPLNYIFFKYYHDLFSRKQQKASEKIYVYLRTKGADPKRVRAYMQNMVDKFCCGDDFISQCQKYQEMFSTFEDFENKAHKKLQKDTEGQ